MSEQTLTIGTPRRLPAGPSGRLRSGRVIVAALVVLAVIAYLVYTGFQSTSVYYLTVSELKARGASQPFTAQVRVAGVVQENSVQRSTSDATLRFTMADDGGSLPVVYKGMVPDIFGPGIQVVVEGRYTSDGVFQASTLLAKCPSKFTAAVPTPAVSGPAR